MSNDLLVYQQLTDLIKEQTLERGIDGFWEWYADELDDAGRQLVLQIMGDPAFGLAEHQIMPRVDAQAVHYDPKTGKTKPQVDAAGNPINWRKWFLLMGRGAGKTHSASTNTHLFARYLYPGVDGMLVGPDHKHVREVMIEGESGLIATAPPDFVPTYQPMYSRVVWPNGSKAMIYTSDNPEAIRGPSLYWAWADELAKWKSEKSYENLLATLRNKHAWGNRLILTTSPISSKKWLRDIERNPDCITTRATSFDNTAGLDAGALAEWKRKVETGSKRAREEYLGEWIDEADKLWTTQQLDGIALQKQHLALADFCAELDSRILAIDPGGKRDLTGIVLVGRKGDDYWVLGDWSMPGSKTQWETRVAEIRRQYMQDGDRIIVETNAHGEIDADLRAMLHRVGLGNTYVEGKHQPPHQGKMFRAERANELYERGEVRHFRVFPELHQQMEEFYEVVASTKQSPDRVDALCIGLNWYLDNKAVPFRILSLPYSIRFDH